MRDRPPRNSAPRLEWPGGIVPEWAKPQGNPNKRRRGKGKHGHGGHERQGGSSPGKRERLQKVMAQSGHGSRRNIEILIAQGHITINGQVAKLGDLVGPGDKVKMDGEPITLRFGDPLPRVLLYHKPEGEIVTRDDPEGRATVFEKLPRVHNGRWVSIGRLDLNTGGLLMFTTSGELANRMMHPRFEVEREYAVRLMGELTDETRAKLLEGIDIEGELCRFDLIEDRGGEGSNHWHHVVLREGKNREVRKMFETVGLMVSRLMRVRFGPIAMPTFLKRGMMKEMEEAEVAKLLEFAGLQQELAQAAAAPAPATEEGPAAAGTPAEEDDDLQPPGISHTQTRLGLITQQPGGRHKPRGPRHGAHQGQGQGAGQGPKFGKQGKHRKHRKGGGQPHGPQAGPGNAQGQPGAQPGQGGQRKQWQGKQGGQGNKQGGRGKQRFRQRGDEQPRFPSEQARFGISEAPQPVEPRSDEQPRFYVDMDRPPRGDDQPRYTPPKNRPPRGDKQPRFKAPRGDEQPRFKPQGGKPPRGDEQPRFEEAEKKTERGDEQPLTNENRRVW